MDRSSCERFPAAARRRRCPGAARERIGPGGRIAATSGGTRSSCSVRPPSRPILSARFPSTRSRHWTWWTWWPGATVFPAGETGASIRPAAGSPIRRTRNTRASQEYPVGDRQVSSRRGVAVCRWRFHSRRQLGPGADRFRRPRLRGVSRDLESIRPATSGRAACIPFNSRSRVWTKLGGVDYASAGHGVLSCSPTRESRSIWTAIRRANPAAELVRFRATAGNTEPASIKGELVSADLWVLVDGQERFRRREINGCNGAFPVVVPFGDNDRFLTLASTDGGNGSRLGLDNLRRSAAGVGDSYADHAADLQPK